MVFSNTTDKNGIIQTIEFWTNLGDAGISGDATLLKVMTSRVNAGFDKIMPLLLSYSDTLRFDDPNHSDEPFETVNLTSGTNSYKDLEDDNNLDILNLVKVMILPSSSATNYVELERMTLDDSRVAEAMSPNSTTTGIPTHFLEAGQKLYLYPNPNYSATAGIKKFFEREQSYFASTDTTKEPGIPKPFHALLSLYPAHDWLLINKPNQTSLITRLEAEIARTEAYLRDMIAKRHPTVSRIQANVESTR